MPLLAREFRLKEALAPIAARFDYVFIDCPPSLGLLTVNALAAAHSVLIPLQCEYFALEGISELMSTLQRVQKALNPDLELEGVLLTMVDERMNLTQQVMARGPQALQGAGVPDRHPAQRPPRRGPQLR